MFVWIVPLCVFAPVTALYLGGTSAQTEHGGGPRELLGLMATLAVFLLVWWIGRTALGGFLGFVPAIIASTLVAAVLLPVAARLGFLVVGLRLGHAAAGSVH